MNSTVLHETAQRVRVALPAGVDAGHAQQFLAALPGVRAVRVNARLRCAAVHHDGLAATRRGLLAGVASLDRDGSTGARVVPDAHPAHRSPMHWAVPVAAALLPAWPGGARRGAALAVVGARLALQPQRLRDETAAALLDAASLAALALSGQTLAVSASVLLRWFAERGAGHLVRQTDGWLAHLLPEAADRYPVLAQAAAPGAGARWERRPLQALRPGDRVRLGPGDVVPVDGHVVEGQATLQPALLPREAHRAAVGEHLSAGERLRDGGLVLQAEADARRSRLERLRAQVHHAIGSRDPAGALAPGLQRLVDLPLTAAALVLGLTGDSVRAAAMLQADPKQGIDLSLPLAREGALLALARQGLLIAGLEAVERLATAPVVVLQDSGVLASGRWTVEAIEVEAGGDEDRVRTWLAELAGLPAGIDASVADGVLREWLRHGAVLRLGSHELHLASRRLLTQVWGLHTGREPALADDQALRRDFAVVAAGRVVAWVVLRSDWRPRVAQRLADLRALGVERVAVCGDDSGATCQAPALQPPAWRADRVPEGGADRHDWVAEAGRDGRPMLIVHTVLRDLLPPGSLSLTTPQAEAGAHGVLLGDPLASLVAARQLARRVRARLRLQQGAAATLNAGLMASSALRWTSPLANALVHHGFALLLLVDGMRVASLTAGEVDAPRMGSESQ